MIHLSSLTSCFLSSFLPPLPCAFPLPPLLSLTFRLYPWSLHLSSVYSYSAKHCLRPFLSLVLKPSSLLLFPSLIVWILCLPLLPLLTSSVSSTQHSTIFIYFLILIIFSLLSCAVYISVTYGLMFMVMTFLSTAQSSRNVQQHFEGLKKERKYTNLNKRHTDKNIKC